jgi:hypothetical protein
VELATPLEKAAMGGRRSGEGGRPAAMLGRSRDVGRWSGGTMKRETRSPRWRGAAKRGGGVAVRLVFF